MNPHRENVALSGDLPDIFATQLSVIYDNIRIRNVVSGPSTTLKSFRSSTEKHRTKVSMQNNSQRPTRNAN